MVASLEKYEAALGLFRAVGDRLGEANVLLQMGDQARAARDYDRSRNYYDTTLQLYTMIGDRYSLARVLYRLGDWFAEQEQKEAARPYYQRAIALWQAIGLDDLVESILLPRLKRVE